MTGLLFQAGRPLTLLVDLNWAPGVALLAPSSHSDRTISGLKVRHARDVGDDVVQPLGWSLDVDGSLIVIEGLHSILPLMRCEAPIAPQGGALD